MVIKSSAFDNNQEIPTIHTCDGDDISPHLAFSGVPEGAKSLALIVDDPDAPGGVFTHWFIWNIPPDSKGIEENEWPEGSEQGMNDGGGLGYMGPCPPNGMHHYHFKLFALDKKLDLNPDVTIDELVKEIELTKVDDAELVGQYVKENI